MRGKKIPQDEVKYDYHHNILMQRQYVLSQPVLILGINTHVYFVGARGTCMKMITYYDSVVFIKDTEKNKCHLSNEMIDHHRNLIQV